jgi:S-formylglutathione hydrolase
VLALRQPGRYASVSAFAPVAAPMQCPWGVKAFTGYLGTDKSTWTAYDTTELIRKATTKQELFVDQGGADKFLSEQLKPEILQQVCKETAYPLRYRQHEGYDHSYYFIASFVEDHLRYHAARLK